MKREEEIKQAANARFEDIECCWSFITGAEWADNNPPQDVVNLNKVWHDASEEPEIGSNIVAIDKNWQWWDIQSYDGEYNGGGDLIGWRCCVVLYNNIQYWAYVNDLLPKNK